MSLGGRVYLFPRFEYQDRPPVMWGWSGHGNEVVACSINSFFQCYGELRNLNASKIHHHQNFMEF